MRILCRFGIHKWEGCRCLKCTVQRHDWKGTRCQKCGEMRTSDEIEYVRLKEGRNAIAEHNYIIQHPCSCNGAWRKGTVSSDHRGCTILCDCTACGLKKRFEYKY